jgi:hypothetical protein
MDEFDRFLETQLRRLLDPVAATRPPSRGRRQSEPIVLAVEPPEAIPTVEIVPVTIAVAPLPQV